VGPPGAAAPLLCSGALAFTIIIATSPSIMHWFVFPYSGSKLKSMAGPAPGPFTLCALPLIHLHSVWQLRSGPVAGVPSGLVSRVEEVVESVDELVAAQRLTTAAVGNLSAPAPCPPPAPCPSPASEPSGDEQPFHEFVGANLTCACAPGFTTDTPVATSLLIASSIVLGAVSHRAGVRPRPSTLALTDRDDGARAAESTHPLPRSGRRLAGGGGILA